MVGGDWENDGDIGPCAKQLSPLVSTERSHTDIQFSLNTNCTNYTNIA